MHQGKKYATICRRYTCNSHFHRCWQWCYLAPNVSPPLARAPTQSPAAYSQVGAYLIVVSASRPNKDAIPHVEGVHHKEVDDSLQQLLEGVAEAEAEGQYQRGAGEPRPVQVHLHPTYHHGADTFWGVGGGGGGGWGGGGVWGWEGGRLRVSTS